MIEGSAVAAVIVAVMTFAGTVGTALVSRRGREAGAKVASDVAVLEGYDELTAHFRETVRDLNQKNAALQMMIEAMHEEIRVLRDDHAALWHALRNAGIDIPAGVTPPQRRSNFRTDEQEEGGSR
jgi:outer membrane murein-binding lipoprotein Lpp